MTTPPEKPTGRPLSPLPPTRAEAGPELAPLPAVRVSTAPQRSKFRRQLVNKGFHWLCIFSATVSIAVLAILLLSIGIEGKAFLDGVNTGGLSGQTVAVPVRPYGYVDAPREALTVSGGSYAFSQEGKRVEFAAGQVVEDEYGSYTVTDDTGAKHEFSQSDLLESDLEYAVDSTKLEPTVDVWKIKTGDGETRFALADEVRRGRDGQYTVDAYEASGRSVRRSKIVFGEDQIEARFKGVAARSGPASSIAFGIATDDDALSELTVSEGREPVDNIGWWGRTKRYTEFFGFLTSFPSRFASQAGLAASLWGSVLLCIVCGMVAIPLGVATAIALEEFKPRVKAIRRVHNFININVANLAGVPSIVYGILGLTVFVRMWGVFGSSNIANYDEMYLLTLRDGTELRAEMIDPYGLHHPGETVTYDSPIAGRHVIPGDDVDSYKRIHVWEHVFTLKDGREITGRDLKWDNETGMITIEQTPEGASDSEEPVSGEEVTFSRNEVAGMRGNDMTALGGPDDWYYLRIPFGSSVLAGGLTLALLVLPIVIVSSREALRAVPNSLREASFALGCTRWQMVRGTILPAAIPGIMTGSILAMSRAIGEAAPLLVIGAPLFIMFTPGNVMSEFAAMPLQIFNWAGRPQEEFHQLAASGILILLAVLLTFNISAAIMRQRFQKPLQ